MADEGGSGSRKIARLTKGDKTRTARHAAVMNEIIDRLNAFSNAKVIREKANSDGSASGKIVQSDANWVLHLKDGLGVPNPPTSGIYALIDRDGTVSWELICQGDETGLGLD